jgi:tRNA splicing ligase
MEEFVSFEWLGDKESESYSDVYNNLLKTEKSTMTVEECREFAKMVGFYDVDDYIEEILRCRKEMADNIKEDGAEKALGEPLEDFVRNAYPFEILFVARY